MSEFDRFGLDGAEPAWSSSLLEAAIDRSLAEGTPEDLIHTVHRLLARPDLPRVHINFVRDFVGAMLRKSSAGSWTPESIGTPGQALLTAYLLPDDRFDSDLIVEILSKLEKTEAFDDAVVEMQDLVLRPEVARRLFASRPELAKRVRSALAH